MARDPAEAPLPLSCSSPMSDQTPVGNAWVGCVGRLAWTAASCLARHVTGRVKRSNAANPDLVIPKLLRHNIPINNHNGKARPVGEKTRHTLWISHPAGLKAHEGRCIDHNTSPSPVKKVQREGISSVGAESILERHETSNPLNMVWNKLDHWVAASLGP